MYWKMTKFWYFEGRKCPFFTLFPGISVFLRFLFFVRFGPFKKCSKVTFRVLENLMEFEAHGSLILSFSPSSMDCRRSRFVWGGCLVRWSTPWSAHVHQWTEGQRAMEFVCYHYQPMMHRQRYVITVWHSFQVAFQYCNFLTFIPQ